MITLVIYFLCGGAVGFMGAFLGVGGGVLIIPILTLLFDVNIHTAVATSLVIVIGNSLAASERYLKKGGANLHLALFLGLASVSGSLIGSHAGLALPPHVLFISLGVIQLLTAFIMIADKKLKLAKPIEEDTRESFLTGRYHEISEGKNIVYTPRKISALMVISAFAGAMSGLVGVGGSVVVVPAMNILSRVPIKAATSTAGLMMGFTSAGGALVYCLSGYTDFKIAASMVPSMFIASYFCTKLFVKVKSDKIQTVFIVFLTIIAVQMLIRGIR